MGQNNSVLFRDVLNSEVSQIETTTGDVYYVPAVANVVFIALTSDTLHVIIATSTTKTNINNKNVNSFSFSLSVMPSLCQYTIAAVHVWLHDVMGPNETTRPRPTSYIDHRGNHYGNHHIF